MTTIMEDDNNKDCQPPGTRKSEDVESNTIATSTTPITSTSMSTSTWQRIPPMFVDTPFSYHYAVTVKIDTLNDLGWGVGHLINEEDLHLVQNAVDLRRTANTATAAAVAAAVTTATTSSDPVEGSEMTTTTTTPVAANGSNNNNKKKKSSKKMTTPTPLPLLLPEEWQIHVPHVLEGEVVRARIFKNFDTYSEADFDGVLEASPDRVQPKCPLAGTCGGCQFQHMKMDKQRQWKTDYVRRGLEAQTIRGYEDVKDVLSPTLGTDQIYEYRNKLTPHYEAPVKVGEDEYELQAIGFQQLTTKRLVDVEDCPIATPAINAAYQEIRKTLHAQAQQGLLNNKKRRKRHRRAKHKVDLGATLLFRQADDDEEGNPVIVTDHTEYMTTTVKGIKFRYLAGNFFQNNDYVVPLMVDGVINAALRPVMKRSDDHVQCEIRYLIDCYCGSGLFALSASSKVDLCVGIEVNEKAVEEATANAKENNITNCQFVAASAEAIFTSSPALTIPGYEEQRIQDFPRHETCVVLDPPRKGCSGTFLEQLYAYGPQRIVYMSCGPATQARDAKGIVEVGGYSMVSIQPFDLFPQTKHVECLILFEKTSFEVGRGAWQ